MLAVIIIAQKQSSVQDFLMLLVVLQLFVMYEKKNFVMGERCKTFRACEL